MNIEKLIELTQQYKQIDQQIEDLVNQKEQIETQIENMTGGGGSASPSPKRRVKRRAGITRHTKSGDEIGAYEQLCIEYFSSKPDAPIQNNDLYNEFGANNYTERSRVRSAVSRLRNKGFVVQVYRGVHTMPKGSKAPLVGPVPKKQLRKARAKGRAQTKEKPDAIKGARERAKPKIKRATPEETARHYQIILIAMPKGKVIKPQYIWEKINLPHAEWKKWNRKLLAMADLGYVKRVPYRSYKRVK